MSTAFAQEVPFTLLAAQSSKKVHCLVGSVHGVDLVHRQQPIQRLQQQPLDVGQLLGGNLVRIAQDQQRLSGQGLGHHAGEDQLPVGRQAGVRAEEEDDCVAHLGHVQYLVEGVEAGRDQREALLEPRHHQVGQTRLNTGHLGNKYRWLKK